MSLFAIFAGLCVALLHVYILVLEMVLWTRPLGLKTFRNTLEKAHATRVLAANQGLYNGFLAAGLLWGALQARADVLSFFWAVSSWQVATAPTASTAAFFRAGLARVDCPGVAVVATLRRCACCL